MHDRDMLTGIQFRFISLTEFDDGGDDWKVRLTQLQAHDEA